MLYIIDISDKPKLKGTIQNKWHTHQINGSHERQRKADEQFHNKCVPGIDPKEEKRMNESLKMILLRLLMKFE